MIHILDLEIREVIHNLNLVVRATGDNFPQTGFIGKMPDLLHLEIGEMIDYLDLIVGETANELNASVNFREVDVFACHADLTDGSKTLFRNRLLPCHFLALAP